MEDKVVKTSAIELKVGMNENNLPVRMKWSAEDGDVKDAEARAFLLSIWDPAAKNTMKIDLWTKDMPVTDMKRFYIDCLGGMAQSVLNATGDEFMAQEMNDLCEKMVAHVEKEMREQGQ